MILISNIWKGNAFKVNVNIVIGSEPLVVLPPMLNVPRVR